MKSSKVKTLCVSGCCNAFRQVAFYINKKTGLPGGNYCKECRKLSAGTIGRTRNAPCMRQGKQLSGNNLYGKSHVATGTYSACP